MATIEIPDPIWSLVQAVAYSEDRAPDELAATILNAGARARMVAAPPRSKAEMMAALRERRRRERYGEDYRERYCLQCGGQLPTDSLPSARYCTPRCRQRAYRERAPRTRGSRDGGGIER